MGERHQQQVEIERRSQVLPPYKHLGNSPLGRQTVGEGGPSVSMQSLASVSPLLATLATLSSPLSTVTTEPPLQRDRGEVSSLQRATWSQGTEDRGGRLCGKLRFLTLRAVFCCAEVELP